MALLTSEHVDRRLTWIAAAFSALGCARAPSPLYPVFVGSVGMPHRGVLLGGIELATTGPGYQFLRDDDRHHATPRFAAVLARAAERVARERPGATLVFGDLSRAGGGTLLPHLSHRTGRDADLVLYTTTVDGAPVASPGFIHFGTDALAWDPHEKRYLRFDVEREWLLVRTLLEDPEARIQWIFSNHNVESLLIEWAVARGESTEMIWRAQQVMLEPHPGGPHDDHIHVRTACDADEIARGCEPSGPARPWLAVDASSGAVDDSNETLVRELLRPIEGGAVLAAAGTR